MIFRSVCRNQQLVRVERRPHGFADPASQIESGKKINIIHVEANGLGLNGVVKLSRNPVGGRQFAEQASNVAAIMKGCPLGLRL